MKCPRQRGCDHKSTTGEKLGSKRGGRDPGQATEASPASTSTQLTTTLGQQDRRVKARNCSAAQLHQMQTRLSSTSAFHFHV